MPHGHVLGSWMAPCHTTKVSKSHAHSELPLTRCPQAPARPSPSYPSAHCQEPKTNTSAPKWAAAESAHAVMELSRCCPSSAATRQRESKKPSASWRNRALVPPAGGLRGVQLTNVLWGSGYKGGRGLWRMREKNVHQSAASFHLLPRKGGGTVLSRWAGPPLAGRQAAVGVTGQRTLLAAQARSVHELGPGSLQAPGGAVSHGEDAPGTQVWRGKQPRGQETQREPPLARAAAARCPAPCMASQSVSFPYSFLPSSLFLYPKAPLWTSALLPACWPPMRRCMPSSPCLPRDLSAGCRRCQGALSWHNSPSPFPPSDRHSPGPSTSPEPAARQKPSHPASTARFESSRKKTNQTRTDHPDRYGWL